VKCTNKITSLFLTIVLTLSVALSGCAFTGSEKTKMSQEEKDNKIYSELNNESDMVMTPYTVREKICVTAGDIQAAGFTSDNSYASSGLFDVNGQTVLESKSVFDKLYPASTTKILTAYIALKYGNLDDIVTVTDNAVNLESGSQMCGLKSGDKITLRDILYGMLLYSGNDAAVAVAEHISGSVSAFVDLMNKEASELMATHSHFANPDGLHDDNHYTTAYDLYLIFNACIQNETFTRIIDTPSYNGTVTHSNGTQTMITWNATNYYSQNLVTPPANVTVIGGKTGTTDQAGSCLILYSKSSAGAPYISIILKATNKTVLYAKMNELISIIP